MILIRIFWAVCLAGLMGYTFHRAWKWEHGAPLPQPVFGGDKPRTKETLVWINPLFLPMLLLVLFVMLGVTEGMDGVNRFLSLSLDVMIIISIYFLLLIFLLPVFRKYFSARACATMWILPAFMFWQVHILLQYAPVPSFVIYIPSYILEFFFPVWMLGFVVVFAGKMIAHLVFRHRIMSEAIAVKDPAIRELFDRELQQLEYYHPVRLVVSPAVAAPLSMGSWKRTRVTVLPDREFTHQQLQLIFQHEIHHLQRGDVSNKVFFAFCQALCWFNPLIWIATRKASDDLELSCDEIVLEYTDDDMRRQYAELLLNTAGQSRGFTTCLSAAAQTMRYRLKNIVTIRNRPPGAPMPSIAMVLCVVCYWTIAVSNDKGTVEELIPEFRSAADVASVYYQPAGDTHIGELYHWDSEGLYSYLKSLDVEKLSSSNTINGTDWQHLTVVIGENGTMQLMFHDKYIKVYYFRQEVIIEYYYLRSGLDWKIIQGYLV